MTTAEARRLLQCKTEYEMAKRLGITQSAVTQWGRMVPKARQKKILELVAAERFAKRLGKVPF